MKVKQNIKRKEDIVQNLIPKDKNSIPIYTQGKNTYLQKNYELIYKLILNTLQKQFLNFFFFFFTLSHFSYFEAVKMNEQS